MRLSNLRYAARLARRTPFLTLVVVFILAGGIALTTCVFGLVNAVWLRPLPYPTPQRLVVVNQSHPRLGYASLLAPSLYEAMRVSRGWADGIGAFAERSFTLGRTGARAERVRGVSIDPELLALLGARTVAGRSLHVADARPGAARVALVSERFWRRQGGEPGFVGSAIRLDGIETTIVGVLPYDFRVVNSGFEVFTARQPSDGAERGRSLFVVARLVPGLTPNAATARLQALHRVLPDVQQPDERGWLPLLRPLDAVLGGEARPAFLLLLTAALLLLALVAANVANLLIARSERRRQEFAVRLAIGAGRRNLVGQLFTEALLLAAAAATLALLLCLWLQSILVAAVPEMTDLRLDGRVFGFALGVSLLVGLALGYLPALSVLRHDVLGGLNSDASGTREVRRRGRPLAVAQLAAAGALLTCCGLLVRGAFAVRAIDPGFDTSRLLTASVSLPATSYPSLDARHSFYERLSSRLASLPGVVTVGLTSRLPLDGGVGRIRVALEDRPTPSDEAMQASRKTVDASYLAAIGARTLAGEPLRGENADAVLVNASMARALWKTEAAAVGARLQIDGGPWRTVTGVVADVRQLLTAPAAPEIYLPLKREAPAAMSVVLRTAGEPTAAASSLAVAIQQLDPEVAVADVWPMTAIVDSYVPRPIVGAFLLLSTMALLLGALGLYAVIAFQVARRTREFGIRVALGADARRLQALVLSEGLRLTGVGLLVGTALGLALGRLLASRFAEVRSLDPALFGSVAMLLGVVSLAACIFPARRATRVSPAEALRRE